MYQINFVLLCHLLVLLLPMQAQATKDFQNIAFTSADLDVSYPPQGKVGTEELKAYKHIQNGKADGMKLRHQYRWYSIGIPKFVRFQDGKLAQILDFGAKKEVLLKVQTLSMAHRAALAQRANVKYSGVKGKKVEPRQIGLVPLKYFRCYIRIPVESGKDLVFHGKASKLGRTILTVSFETNKAEAQLLIKHLVLGIPMTYGYQFLHHNRVLLYEEGARAIASWA